MNEVPSAKIPVEYRKATTHDFHFVLDAWLKDYRASSLFARHIPSQVFFFNHRKIIEELLAKPISVVIACNPENHTQYYGFMAYERVKGSIVLHYVYTKLAFRSFGIAREMLFRIGYQRGFALPVTHWTMACKNLKFKYCLTYNPYLFLREDTNADGELEKDGINNG